MCRVILLPLVLALWANSACGQPAPAQAEIAPAPALAGQALVDRALANELSAAEDQRNGRGRLMRYQLRKTTPRLATTKEILETEDGDVARLIAIDDRPLSPAAEQDEEARLSALLADPGKQRRRKVAEDQDSARAIKILRALPTAFLYRDAGPVDGPAGKPDSGPAGKLEMFTFRPNPAFNPPDLETEVLTAMTGAIWIDPGQARIVRFEGRLEQDVNFGWGVLGRLNKGGSIAIEQAPVNDDQWRIVRFEMHMSGRVVFKNRVFDTTEEESHFAPLPAGLGYRQAIAMLLDQK